MNRIDIKAPRLGWLLLLGLPLLLWALLHPRGVAVEVVGKQWVRQVEIERQVPEMHSEPCAQMPANARLLEQLLHEGAAHCRFEAAVWRKRRHEATEGDATSAPRWPVLALNPGERAGRRHAWQLVMLRDDAGRSWDCRLPLADWLAWKPGARTRLAVHRFTGVADCSTLPVTARRPA